MNLFDYVQQRVSGATEEEIIDAIAPATEKLQRIIQREGDAEGERFKPYYIAQLIAEHLIQERFTKECFENKKSGAAEASTNLTNKIIIAL